MGLGAKRFIFRVALAKLCLGVATRQLEELRESREDGLAIQKYVSI